MYFLLLVLKEKYQWPGETWCQGYQSITNQMSTCICFQIWKTRKTHKVCHIERKRERDEQIYTNREVETMFICGIAMHAIVFYFSLLLCYSFCFFQTLFWPCCQSTGDTPAWLHWWMVWGNRCTPCPKILWPTRHSQRKTGRYHTCMCA